MKKPLRFVSAYAVLLFLLLTAAPVQAQGTPGVSLSTTALTVPEGGSASYTLNLNTEPAAGVTIGVSRRSGDRSLTASPSSLVFTPANWSMAQDVTISAAEDDDARPGVATFEHTATSAEGDYNGITIAHIMATEDDNDMAGVSLSTTTLQVPEGSSASYFIRLYSQPTTQVYISLLSLPGGDAGLTVSPATLTFEFSVDVLTRRSWDIPQRVTISAAEDNDAVAGTLTIAHTASSLEDQDPDYNAGLSIANVVAVELDDTPVGVNVKLRLRVFLEGPLR